MAEWYDYVDTADGRSVSESEADDECHKLSGRVSDLKDHLNALCGAIRTGEATKSDSAMRAVEEAEQCCRLDEPPECTKCGATGEVPGGPGGRRPITCDRCKGTGEEPGDVVW